jgi:hypothetical protein
VYTTSSRQCTERIVQQQQQQEEDEKEQVKQNKL